MDSDNWEGFWIGQQPTLFLRVVYLVQGPHQGEGWHGFLAEAVVPGFSARFNFDARLGEFRAFAKEVRAMHESLAGTAHFASMEFNVEIDAQIDRLGHVTWEVTLRSQDMGPELRFSIEEDQTLLWNVAAKIDDMLEAIGQPQTS